MRYYTQEDIEDYIINKEGERISIPKIEFYRFSIDHENNTAIMINNSGYLPDIKQIKALIHGLSNFVDEYDQENIDAENESIRNHFKNNEILNKKIEKEKIDKKPGYVYFIKDNLDNIKIGLAQNIEKRFKNYTEMAYDPEIIFLLKCHDTVKVEKYFHNKFASKRFKGEWFKLDSEDIKFINSFKYSKEIMKYIIEKSNCS